jgi:hypothetical protein
MAELPATDDSVLVRTFFGDQSAWRGTLEAALAENDDGFRAYVTVVDDETFDGASWEQLRDAVQATRQHASVLFVADSAAMRGAHPILVVDLDVEARPPFRCAAGQLWSVDNNLNLANIDWQEFATALDGDGMFRGLD